MSWNLRYANDNIKANSAEHLAKFKDLVEWMKVPEVAKYKDQDRLGEDAIHEDPQSYIDKLKKDIATNGFTTPLILEYHPEKQRVMLTEGHHRLLAAQQMGLTHVPVVGMKSAWSPARWKKIPEMSDRLKEQGFPSHGYYYPGRIAPSKILGKDIL